MDIDSLKRHLQRHFSDGMVIVVGSGLSCGEGLPGMPALGEHLRSVIGDGLSASELERWHLISSRIEQVGIEAALSENEPPPQLALAISTATADYLLVHERRVIAEVFRGERTLRFTRLLRHLLKPADGIPVVTTNYDRLIEVAAEEAGLGADTLFTGYFAGKLNERESHLSFCIDVKLHGKSVRRRYRDRVLIYKPHGSLDWYQRGGIPVRYGGDLPGISRLIIPPGRNKLRSGYESPFDRHRERANGAIDNASRYLVIGYGFNDDHLETHLTPMIRGGRPTLILSRSLSTNAAKLARDCPKVTALSQAEREGAVGTLAIVDRSDVWLPRHDLWDLTNFITEVLEP